VFFKFLPPPTLSIFPVHTFALSQSDLGWKASFLPPVPPPGQPPPGNFLPFVFPPFSPSFSSRVFYVVLFFPPLFPLLPFSFSSGTESRFFTLGFLGIFFWFFPPRAPPPNHGGSTTVSQGVLSGFCPWFLCNFFVLSSLPRFSPPFKSFSSSFRLVVSFSFFFSSRVYLALSSFFNFVTFSFSFDVYSPATLNPFGPVSQFVFSFLSFLRSVLLLPLTNVFLYLSLRLFFPFDTLDGRPETPHPPLYFFPPSVLPLPSSLIPFFFFWCLFF